MWKENNEKFKGTGHFIQIKGYVIGFISNYCLENSFKYSDGIEAVTFGKAA